MTRLEWDGYRNCKDLGGLPTPLSPSGRTVPGRIARGPRRELLTSQGWQDAHSWGLRSIVDLRCADEIGPRDFDPQAAAENYDGVTIINAPTEDQNDAEFRRICFPILDSPEYWEHNWRLQPDLIRNTLDTIAAADPGVLIHCAAGRDRTGMISAILLGNAGVDPEHVAEDYATSVLEMAGTQHHSPTTDRQSGWTPERVRQWLPGKMEIVREVASGTAEIFDSLGVSSQTQLRLRRLLTEPEHPSETTT